jgi:hypothetical protein
MRRRQFLEMVGIATGWPTVIWAQPANNVRRIGVLLERDGSSLNRLGIPKSEGF